MRKREREGIGENLELATIKFLLSDIHVESSVEGKGRRVRLILLQRNRVERLQAS